MLSYTWLGIILLFYGAVLYLFSFLKWQYSLEKTASIIYFILFAVPLVLGILVLIYDREKFDYDKEYFCNKERFDYEADERRISQNMF